MLTIKSFNVIAINNIFVILSAFARRISWDPSLTLRMTKRIHLSWRGKHVVILRA